ncbi:DUF885 domain-containing protein [Povalibacter sp.]|uniref:DUF885 domain-containing protein n=1 Tax=Povalibacter sp. TaxID=1962978 RepID=UPI002F40E362
MKHRTTGVATQPSYAFPRPLRSTAVLAAAFAALCCLSLPSAAQSTAATQLQAFIDSYVAENEHPKLTSLSAQSFTEELAKTQADLKRLRAIDTTKLTLDEQIDWEFGHSILRGDEIEQQLTQPWKKDPRVYMRFNDIARAIGQPGEISAKADDVLSRLKLVPEQIENGRKNLEQYVPRFQELSVFMATGAVSMLDRDVPAFARTVPGPKQPQLLQAAAAAKRSMEGYIRFLETDLPKRPAGDFAIGAAAYNAILKDQYLLSYDVDSLFEFAKQEFDKTVAEMEAVARKIDPGKTWQQLCEEIKNDYPDPHKMIEVHQEWVDKAKQHILSKGLVPIPWKERANVVPRAEYLRKYSYYGNFSRARKPDAQGVLVAEWMINPFEDQWDEKTKNEYLVEHDYGVIIVTAPHETYAGHHVQGLYQMHNPSKLRRTNGISIFSEGWGLYNEQLMRETGFFPNDRIVLRALQLRLWRNARVIWDVGIHSGKMSYEEAISLLSDRVGFLRWAAQLEVDGSAASPVYRIGYFLGMSEILRLRADYQKLMGDKFTLSDFHEKLLKVGNMPPALMRKGLLASITE